jgi:hypothetical protein
MDVRDYGVERERERGRQTDVGWMGGQVLGRQETGETVPMMIVLVVVVGVDDTCEKPNEERVMRRPH